MKTKKTINHIVNSITKAETYQSKLDNSVLTLPGQSGKKGRHFLNNILNYPDVSVNYLEIGLLEGSTLVSSLYKNDINKAYAVELSTTTMDTILSHKESKNIEFELIISDCFKLDLNRIKEKINIYLFDGGHTYEDHYKSLEYYYPILEDKFIFVVDDWLDKNDRYYNDWKQVPDATYKAIEDLNLNILYEKSMPRSQFGDDWWGGMWVALLEKK